MLVCTTVATASSRQTYPLAMAVVHRRLLTAGHAHKTCSSTLYSTSDSLALGSFHRLGDQASEAAIDAHAQGRSALHHAITHTLNTPLLHHITPR